MANSSSVHKGHSVRFQRKPAKQSTAASKRTARPAGSTSPRRKKMPLPLPSTLLSSASPPARQAQPKLDAMRDCYAALYDYSQAGFLRLDTLGKVVDANLTAATMFGINRKALIGQPLVDFIGQDDQKTFELHCRNVLKKNLRQNCTVQLRSETGAMRLVSIESRSVMDNSGRITHWWTMLRDITEDKQATEKLAQMAERLELATSAAEIGVWDWNIQRNELVWDDRMFALYGVKRAHFGGAYDAWLSAVHPDDQARCNEAIQLALDNEKPYDIEFRILWPDGTVRIIKADGQVIWGRGGRPLRMIGVNYDITDRKQAEEILRRSEAFITSVMETLPDMVFVKDAQDLKFVRINKAGEDLLGYPRESLIGKSDYDFFPKPEADFFTDTDRQVLKSGRLHDIPEEPIQTSDKGQRILHTKKIPILDAAGAPQYLLGISEDITERKQMADDLLKAKEQLQQVLAASNAGLWELDISTNAMYLSREWISQLGYEEQELANDFETWARLLHADDRDRVLAHLQAYQDNPIGNYRQEFRVRHKDGSYRWVASTASFVEEPDGRQIRMLGTHTDITERKQLEAQFYQAQKMEAVGRFAASVAHDFNNLLTVINGYSALLKDLLPSEDPGHKMVTEALGAGERAASLTKQLLSFSRRQVLKLEPINLNESIRSVSSMLERLLGEDVVLSLDLGEDLWSVAADKGQFDQIVMNLAVNARDAMPEGGTLTVSTRNVELKTEAPDSRGLMPSGHYVKFSIRDTGEGMSQETRARLFEPFYTTKELGKGTGLGLATVYGIVKQCQGYIFVDSSLNQGATFDLYFQRVTRAPAVPDSARAPSKGGSETLLIVEDHDSVRSLIVGVLTQKGYRVIEAAKGEDALRAAAAIDGPVHVLVTDIVMPQLSGDVLAERLRQVWPGLRVLFMTGYTNRLTSAILDKPGTTFIQKPFKPDELATALRELMDKPI
jgi:two-component system, cell cycle sensor histidine kinase and response regulator CckA